MNCKMCLKSKKLSTNRLEVLFIFPNQNIFQNLSQDIQYSISGGKWARSGFIQIAYAFVRNLYGGVCRVRRSVEIECHPFTGDD